MRQQPPETRLCMPGMLLVLAIGCPSCDRCDQGARDLTVPITSAKQEEKANGVERPPNRAAESTSVLDAARLADSHVADDLPADGVGIVIVPKGTARDLVLTFCYFHESKYAPRISRIVLAPVHRTKETWCELSSKRGAWLWREWKVGTAPDGFRARNCSRFSAGEYEILVDAFVGSGSLRIAIDSDGDVWPLPWDNLSGPP